MLTEELVDQKGVDKQMDQVPLPVRIAVMSIAGGFLAYQVSRVLQWLARLARHGATATGRWATRPRTYTAVSIMFGLFALITIFVLAWTDQMILSFSFFVVFPGDKSMRFMAGLAYTLCEIVAGHLCAETIGLSRQYIERQFSSRSRALLCLVFGSILVILLSGEFLLAYRRTLLMATTATPQFAVHLLHRVAQSQDIGADALVAARTSGFIALAVGMADVLVGVALGAALSVIVKLADALLRLCPVRPQLYCAS